MPQDVAAQPLAKLETGADADRPALHARQLSRIRAVTERQFGSGPSLRRRLPRSSDKFPGLSRQASIFLASAGFQTRGEIADVYYRVGRAGLLRLRRIGVKTANEVEAWLQAGKIGVPHAPAPRPEPTAEPK